MRSHRSFADARACSLFQFIFTFRYESSRMEDVRTIFNRASPSKHPAVLLVIGEHIKASVWRIILHSFRSVPSRRVAMQRNISYHFFASANSTQRPRMREHPLPFRNSLGSSSKIHTSSLPRIRAGTILRTRTFRSCTQFSTTEP